MDKALPKMMAVMIAALFCVSAAAAIFINEDSSADGEVTVTHRVYVEVIDENGVTTSSTWFAFDSLNTAASFVAAGTAAAAKYGLPDLSFTYDSTYNSISVVYPGYANACYYGSNGAWAEGYQTAEEYPAAEILAFSVAYGYITEEKYNALSDAEKAKWTVKGWAGYYAMKIPDVGVADAPDIVTHRTYVEVIDESCAKTSTKWFEFESLATPEAFVIDATDAATACGLTTLSFTYDSTYNSISVVYPGYANACYYGSNGAWVEGYQTAEEYPAAEILAFIVGYGYIPEDKYNALSDAEKAKWTVKGWAGYYAMKIPDILPTTREYKVFVEVVNDEGVITTKKWVTFTSVMDAEIYCIDANIAFAANGLDKLTLTYVTVPEAKINSDYDGSGNNCSFYADKGAWVEMNDTVEQYLGYDAAIAADNGWITEEKYDALSDADKANWELGFPGWYKIKLTEPVPGASSGNNDNLILYIVIGVVAALAVVVVAVVFIKKN